MDKLDEAIEETFPASDAPASTVLTGALVDSASAEPRGLRVVDHREANRFELVVDGETAFLTCERRPGSITLIHTEVPESLRGRGLANVIAKAALDAARAEGSSVIAVCPVVRAYLRKHPAGGV